jgi:hypothetical protein
MTTSADIANRAMVAMAARSTIANLALEQSPEAKQMNLLYAPTRDALLRAAHWDFARKLVQGTLYKAAPGVAGSTTTPETDWNPATMPAPPWSYEYLYPGDCLKVRYVTPAPGGSGDPSVDNMFSVPMVSPISSGGINPVPYAIAVDTDENGNQMRVVLTDAYKGLLCYTARIEVEDIWDASFQEAMVYSLAAQTALSITGNLQTAQVCAAKARDTLLVARSRDGNEGTPSVNRTPDWIAARGGGYMVGGSRGATPVVAGWDNPAFLRF